MDLSPKLLTEVEFPEQWRGYNQNQVDEFLERVAAGIGELQRQLAEALERAATAERRLLDRSDEDEIRRTLVLAQRTASATVDEAKTEAARVVGEAEERARSLIEVAEAEAASLQSEIAERRRTELGGLAQQRAALERDIDSLRQFVDAERSRLAEELRLQLASLEGSYVVHASPALAELPRHDLDDVDDLDDLDDAQPVDRRDEPAASGPVDATAAEAANAPASSVDELRDAREELADALRQAGVEPLPIDEAPPSAPADADDDEADVRWRDAEHEDDPFLAELRRAVVDDEPLGPRDHEPAPPPRRDEAEADSGGFFRRGRRRE